MMKALYRLAIPARNEQKKLFANSMKKIGAAVSGNMYKRNKFRKVRENLKILRERPKK
ncbi:MAG: hypothetical protein NPIRA06_29880 [Nitrospirales bacterium]|nr:MAG: hypothetical protein NPIRA06_29880 [Nitrospirales bacterium]